MNKWGDRFLGLCRSIASWSKDPSTKVGAVIARADGTIASLGYNGFPRGIADDDRLHCRELKYELMIHAEMNAILHAREPLHGHMLYTWPCMPCCRCAVHIVQTGIKRCVFPEPMPDVLERWSESFNRTLIILEEAGVEVCPNPT